MGRTSEREWKPWRRDFDMFSADLPISFALVLSFCRDCSSLLSAEAPYFSSLTFHLPYYCCVSRCEMLKCWERTGRRKKIEFKKLKKISLSLLDAFHCFRATRWSGCELIITQGPRRWWWEHFFLPVVKGLETHLQQFLSHTIHSC